MAKTKTHQIKELREVLNELDLLIQARITENRTVAKRQGIMQEQYTQLYMYYRSKIRKAQRIANELK